MFSALRRHDVSDRSDEEISARILREGGYSALRPSRVGWSRLPKTVSQLGILFYAAFALARVRKMFAKLIGPATHFGLARTREDV